LKTILVIYASREGQTQRVAEHVGATLRARGWKADVLDAAHLPSDFRLSSYDGVILGASVHRGQHEKEMIQFVQKHREELDRMPAAFLSLSLSEAGAEMKDAPTESRAQAAADVQRTLKDFYATTGWQPKRVHPVAGALLYTQYNFLLRLVMRLIARQAGGDTDTSRDYEYTDWEALDRFVDEFAAGLGMRN
jgi:menaquinone-dependent protoporphyrinogen oxidase